MSILAYITDLFFQAKVAETARTLGVQVNIVTSLYHFLPQLEKRPSVVLIDLEAQGISPAALIAQIKEKDPELPVIVYGSHVEKDQMAQAQKSGADHVLPRSEFSNDLAQILESAEKKAKE